MGAGAIYSDTVGNLTGWLGNTALQFADRSVASRNSCIIDILFAGGMRIGELIKLNLDDLEGNLLRFQAKKVKLR